MRGVMVFIGGVCSTKTGNGDHGVGDRWGEGYFCYHFFLYFFICSYPDIQSKSNMPYNSSMFSKKKLANFGKEKKWCLCFVQSVSSPGRHRTERAHHHHVRRTRKQLGAPLCAAQIPDSSDTRADPQTEQSAGQWGRSRRRSSFSSFWILWQQKGCAC